MNQNWSIINKFQESNRNLISGQLLTTYRNKYNYWAEHGLNRVIRHIVTFRTFARGRKSNRIPTNLHHLQWFIFIPPFSNKLSQGCCSILSYSGDKCCVCSISHGDDLKWQRPAFRAHIKQLCRNVDLSRGGSRPPRVCCYTSFFLLCCHSRSQNKLHMYLL